MDITDFSLTEQELQQFDRDGFIGPFTLYEPEEMMQMHKTVRAQLFNRTHAPYDAPWTWRSPTTIATWMSNC